LPSSAGHFYPGISPAFAGIDRLAILVHLPAQSPLAMAMSPNTVTFTSDLAFLPLYRLGIRERLGFANHFSVLLVLMNLSARRGASISGLFVLAASKSRC
jgi:hypothetical protein